MVFVSAGCTRLGPSALLVHAAFTRRMSRAIPWLVLDNVARCSDFIIFVLAILIHEWITVVYIFFWIGITTTYNKIGSISIYKDWNLI